MMESTLELELLTPLDWAVLRAARLYALLDSPDAFTSSYAGESTWQESEWQRLLNGATWIVARDNQHVIGLAKSTREPERPACRHIESAWVAPTHRQRGVLRALLRALVAIERQMGVTHFLLWVLENNHAAQCAYQALGFEPTGDRQFLEAFGQYEQRLRLAIKPQLVC
jgi:ribosomal protein S18 acetylase RimI-like enzyme